MTLGAPIWGWEQNSISSPQKLVLLDLCDRANKNDVCWPKQTTIAARTGLTERSVNSALKALETLQLIKHQPRMIANKRTSDWIRNGPAAASIDTEKRS
jgi:DNA-binding MarR family transcriptional regulator